MARFEPKLPKIEQQPYTPLYTGPMVNAALDKVPGSVECPVCHATHPVEKLADVPRACPTCGWNAQPGH